MVRQQPRLHTLGYKADFAHIPFNALAQAIQHSGTTGVD